VNLQKLQHPPKVHILATEGTEKDEKLLTLLHVALKKQDKPYKSLTLYGQNQSRSIKR